MTQHSHQTAPTQFVDAAGVRFAYRRFGKSGGVPLVFNIHFTGTMDHWDPAVTDGFAKDREVILFDNAGISSTEAGTLPLVLEMPALSNRITSRVAARPSVTSGSQWSIVPVKCMLKTSGTPPDLPKRR